MLPDFVGFGSVLTRKDVAKLIGNSVPPPLSFAIGKMLIPLLRDLRSPDNNHCSPVKLKNDPDA